MDVGFLIDQISVIIAAIALAITFARFLTSRQKEASRAEARFAEILAKLANLEEDIKEIKVEQRDYHNELSDTHDVANNALERATYAHERIDRFNCYQFKTREGNDSHGN